MYGESVKKIASPIVRTFIDVFLPNEASVKIHVERKIKVTLWHKKELMKTHFFDFHN